MTCWIAQVPFRKQQGDHIALLVLRGNEVKL
jgi:hypothetical protein